MSDTSDAFGRVAKGAVITFTSTIIGYGLSLFTRIFSSKLLPPAEFGLLVLGITILQIVSRVGDLGLHRGIARNLPRSSNPRGEFTAALVLGLLTGTISGFATIFIAGNLAMVFDEPGFETTLIVVGLGVVGSVLFKLFGGGFRGAEDAIGRSVLQIAKQSTIFTGVILGVVFVGGATGGMLGWVVALFLTVGFAVWLYSRRVDRQVVERRVRVSVGTHGPALVRFSLPLVGAATIWVILHQVDNIFLGYFLESRQVGIYDAGYSLSRLIIMLLLPAEFLFLPITSVLHQEDDLATFRSIYYLTTKSVLLLTVPVYVTLVIFGPELLMFAFRPVYEAGGVVLAILATGFMMNVILGPSRQALTAVGDTDMVLYGAVGGLGINLVLNVALIPQYGMEGAATATAISFTTINVIYVAKLFRDLSVWPVNARIVAITAISLGLLSSIAVLAFDDPSSGIISVFLFGSVAIGLHLTLVILAGGIGDQDVAVLKHANQELSVNLAPLISMLQRARQLRRFHR